MSRSTGGVRQSTWNRLEHGHRQVLMRVDEARHHGETRQVLGHIAWLTRRQDLRIVPDALDPAGAYRDRAPDP